ncbi:MAG: SDR family NAD(P)-dependent oxidoreductase, partial [Ardenticatenia bacterium]|nr:SDR family NAD(P)-dependent oxidoreductase [Ardenticatenia bacterium]
MKFQGKVALVTGGSGGIGQATAVALGGEGATVVVNYLRDTEAAQQTADRVTASGGQALTWQADVVSPSEVGPMAAAVVEQFGRIDILVNNAGGKIRAASFLDVDEELWDACIDLNVKGTFFCSQAVARHMVRQRSGRIINLSSIAGFQTQPDRTHYSVAKAGVVMLTKSMAVELAPHHITANAVAPTYVKTKATADVTVGREDQLVCMHPLGRLALPRDA